MTTTAEKSAEEKATVEKAALGPEKRRALGRGLESLLPGPRPVPGAATAIHGAAAGAPPPGVIGELQAQASSPAGDLVLQVSVEAIDPNPYQTRNNETCDTEDGGNTLAELAESIRANGVIQPVTVRPAKEGRYVLITGERRWRASKLAGKDKVPALVRQVSDQQAAEMTVVENLQRQDLNCMDQARAFVMLSQTFHLTQEQIGNRVGVARETISNYMRLVRLPDNVQRYLQDGELEFSHARLLLILEDDSLVPRVADKVVKEKLSVEQLEDVVFQLNVPFKKQQEEQGTGRARWVDPNVRAAQRQLEQVLGMRVRIRDRKGKGKITIEYASLEDFDRVVKMLRGK